MRFGVFDHVERVPSRPLAEQFDERIKFAVAAEAAGAWGLHIAEHHASPLNMVPAPGIYLAAVARETSTLRIGPLVYLLTVTTPLKLAEEICILDHLCHGRYLVGVGRGVSPHELSYHQVDAAKSRDIFYDAYACLIAALSDDNFSYKGPYFTYDDVPMPLRPMPPFWYASTSKEGAGWGGAQGLHFVTLGTVEEASRCIEVYKEALGKRGGPAQPLADFPGGTAIGCQRHIVVAESDGEAEDIARKAIKHHVELLRWLWKRKGDTEFLKRVSIVSDDSLEGWRDRGMLAAGSPQTVADYLQAQLGDLGINYLLTYLFFGDMTAAQAHRSLELFAHDVMPKLSAARHP